MKINGVRYIFNFNNEIGYVTNEYIIYFNSKRITYSSNPDSYFEVKNENLFVSDIEGNLIKINLNSLSILNLKNDSRILKFPFYDNFYFSKVKIDNLLIKYDFFNKNDKLFDKTLITQSYGHICFDLTILIISNNGEWMQLYDFYTNKIKWTFSAKVLGTYTDYAGVHEGKIKGKVFKCQNSIIAELSSPQLVGTNVKFVGLDIESGNLLWLKEFPLDFYTRLVNYKDELLVLGEYLWKMDPATGELLERYFPFFEVVGRYHNFLITDDYIFIYTLKTEIKQLSRKTGVILWSDALYGDKEAGRRGKTINGNDPIQYADGKLYLLDSEKVLHVLDVANDK